MKIYLLSRFKAIALQLLVTFTVFFVMPATADFVLRMQTDLGAIDIELLDSVAPLTVANFMNYVNDGDYDGTFIHRSIPGFIVQGGGFIFDGEPGSFLMGGTSHIPTDPPVVNEFNLSNVRGTLAMAKLGGDPDSATSEWFFNLVDNSENLDNQNGGFTVFGRVLDDGMDVIDSITTLQRCSDIELFPGLCSPFSDTPFVGSGQFRDDILINIPFLGIDNEGDGTIDKLEDAAPNNGDGNGDTVADSSQTNVASFPGAANDYITIAVSPAFSIQSMNVLGPTFAINSAPDSECVLNGLKFKHGYAGFTISGVAVGGSVDVDVLLPAGESADTYYIFGPTPSSSESGWFEFVFNPADDVGAMISGNVVTLRLADGGLGDADQVSNGIIIVSPGGSAIITSPVDLADDDCDGVLDEDEAGAPNNGDGNDDGIDDSLQANVASLLDVFSGTYVTVEIPPSNRIADLFITDATSILAQSDSLDNLSGVNFSHGFLNVTVDKLEPGSKVSARIFLLDNEKPVKFFKFGPTPGNNVDHLYEFDFNGETGAEIKDNVITLHFVDGKRGDADLTANGVIVDPGTPAIRARNTGGNSGGSAGGGCTMYNKPDAGLERAGGWLVLAFFTISLGAFRIVRRY